MSEPTYMFPCFTTGRWVAEGTADQLREYFNMHGRGEPFDADGNLLDYGDAFAPARSLQEPARPALTLVKT